MESRKMKILYGSETGNAADTAEELWRESKKYHFQCITMSMDSYQMENLINEDIVVFVCSTTGQGEEPYNMKNSWKFLLKKSLPQNSLSDVRIAVLGLGDSSYTKFNYVAKRLYKRLMQLSATSIINLGLCDDQHDMGISAVYLPWKVNLWESLLKLKPLPVGVYPLTEIPQQFKWNVHITVDHKEVRNVNGNASYINRQDSVQFSAFETKVLNNVRTTSDDHYQDVRLITFSAEDSNWEPGDVMYVRPQNSSEHVNALFNIFVEYELNLFPEALVKIEEIDKDMPVPDFLKHPLTLKTIATEYWDLNAIPRVRVFELMALNCSNELEKEKLVEFTTPAGQEELYGYVNRPRRTILEVLHDFPHATSSLTLQVLFEIFAPIKPRAFSIASSAKSRLLEVLVAVVEYQTIMKTPRKGLCSNWLKNLTVGENILVWLRKGTFLLPKDQSIPLVMVGPGTGLAPFRSILQQRKYSSNANGPLVLFFGCRNYEKDFHCRRELEQLELERHQLKVITAFSRDQEDKVYVQHKILEQKELLNDLLIKEKGYFLVSGSSKNMPQAVQAALREVIDDESHIDAMLKNGRYQEETWA